MLSKGVEEFDELNECVIVVLNMCCCLSDICWGSELFGLVVNVEDEPCPEDIQCFPLPTEPNRDVELELNDDDAVDIPPLLCMCKYDDGVGDDDGFVFEPKLNDMLNDWPR